MVTGGVVGGGMIGVWGYVKQSTTKQAVLY